MKTIGRIFIILAVFAIVMGITYIVVNAGGNSSVGIPRFENGERLQFANGERPQFPGGEFEGRREGGERGGGGWMFGLVKNIGIVAVVTILIALPRSIVRNRKRSVPAIAE